jgi:amino acid adenylation domain-containing protein
VNKAFPISFQQDAIQKPIELTSLQRAIWFDQQLRDTNAYNIPVIVNFKHALNVAVLNKVLNDITASHEILRAFFQEYEERPALFVKAMLPFTLEVHNLCELDERNSVRILTSQLEESTRQPFNLAVYPLFRAKLYSVSPVDHRLLFIAHQIILDGTSLYLLMKEMLARYDATVTGEQSSSFLSANQFTKLPGLVLTHDQQVKARQALATELAGIKEQLLPYDMLGDKKDRSGKTLEWTIDGQLKADLDTIAKVNNTSLFTALLTAYVIAVSRFIKSREVLIGIPLSGRTSPTQNMLGVFINTGIVRVTVEDSDSFHSLFQKVKSSILKKLRYQYYPFDALLNDLGIMKEVGKYPLTTIFFNGLSFMNNDIQADNFEVFPGNLGLDMNVDINCYVKEDERKISIRLDYREALFKEKAIHRLLNDLRNILSLCVTNIDAALVDVLSSPEFAIAKSEMDRLLELANGNDVALPANENILTLFERQVERTPENTAIVYKERSLSYKMLNGKANTLSKKLSSLGIKPGVLIPVIADKCFELPLALLAIMKCEAAFVPVDVEWPVERINSLIVDLDPPFVITTPAADTLDLLPQYLRVPVKQEQLLPDSVNPKHALSPGSLIYGFFTSGTTGKPKCALNKHIGLLNRFLYMNKAYSCKENDSILLNSKPVFDPSVWQMFWPLINGAKVVIPSSSGSLNLHELVECIGKHKITITDFVPSIFALFTDYIEINKELVNEISSLRQLLIGGESMNSKVIRRFRALLPQVGVTNTFGPTEASIGTIFYEVGDQFPEQIPIGMPIDNVKVVLLNEAKEMVPFGEIGEVYLGGICLGAGYFNMPEKSGEAFIQNPIGQVNSSQLYRTGDLAFYLDDGNLQFVGRKDDQLKINGMRIEGEEIEKNMLRFAGIKEAVVIGETDAAGSKYLVGFFTGNSIIDGANVKSFLKDVLPEYLVPQYILQLEDFPLNSNGKVDRKKLTGLNVHANVQQTVHVAPVTAVEKILAKIWEEVLNRSTIGVNDNFFDLGGNSLKATRVISRIRKELNAKIELRSFYDSPTINDLAIQCSDATPTLFEPIAVVERAPDYELSNSQQRLWALLHQMDSKSSGVYNIVSSFELTGSLDTEALNTALKSVIRRHEVLRTKFITVNDMPRQVILAPDQIDFELEQLDIRLKKNKTELIQKALSEELENRFALQQVPLLRTKLIRIDEGQFVLIFSMHHIISDGWSMLILMQEVLNFYRGVIHGTPPELLPLSIQYKDYAAWSNQQLKGDFLKTHKEYWLDKLSGELEMLQFPIDFPRPEQKTYESDSLNFTLTSSITNAIMMISQREKVSTFMTMIAFLEALLYRYSWQENIVIGFPIAGRFHQSLEAQIGLYINTLPLRIQLQEQDSFMDVLRKVRATVLEAFEHQSYPFDELVSNLKVSRRLDQGPLFEVGLSWQNMGEYFNSSTEHLPELRIKKLPVNIKYSLHDLWLYGYEHDGTISFDIVYNTKLFKKETIETIRVDFVNLIQSACENTSLSIYQLAKQNRSISEGQRDLLRDAMTRN